MYYTDTDEILTFDEFCEFLNIGKNTAYLLLNTHKVQAFKIGRIWRIPKHAILEYILKECSNSCWRNCERGRF